MAELFPTVVLYASFARPLFESLPSLSISLYTRFSFSVILVLARLRGPPEAPRELLANWLYLRVSSSCSPSVPFFLPCFLTPARKEVNEDDIKVIHCSGSANTRDSLHFLPPFRVFLPDFLRIFPLLFVIVTRDDFFLERLVSRCSNLFDGNNRYSAMVLYWILIRWQVVVVKLLINILYTVWIL